MARRTFFSFHYEVDVWRSAVVRNSAKTKSSIEVDYIDASLWEESKLKGRPALERLINDALVGTSVTAVLIGSRTSERPWVKYEIEQSVGRGNGLLGIYIHNIQDQSKQITGKGLNPLPPRYRTYDWVLNDGYSYLGQWIEFAYRER